MLNPKMEFKPIPSEPAHRPERDDTRAPHSGQVSCVICGSPVSLEDCKFDERGNPVHDRCYLDQLSRPNSDTSKPKSQN